MRKKKIIIWTLCISLVLPQFLVQSLSLAQGAGEKFGNLMSNHFSIKEDAIRLDRQPVEKTIQEQVFQESSSPVQETVFEGQRISIDPEAEDFFELEPEEISQLLQEGYTVEDIYLADELGNELGEHPMDLLQEKDNQKKLDWKAFEESVKDEIRNEQFESIKKEYAEEMTQLQAAGLSEEMQFTLLLYAKTNHESIDDVLKNYKKDGEKAVKTKKNHKKHSVSKENLKKYNLKESEVIGLTDDILDRLVQVAKATNKDVKKVIQDYQQEAQSKQKTKKNKGEKKNNGEKNKTKERKGE